MDDLLHQFLVDGYVEVAPSAMSEADHRGLYADADAIYREAATIESRTPHLDLLGDQALRDRAPDIEKVLNDPAVVGALKELLGADYFVHPHMFLHRATTDDQVFHQDGNLPWNERGHYRPHRSDWALLFYYPQAVTLANGPTEVVPGSQYWTKDFEEPDGSWHPGDSFDRAYREEGVMSSPDLDYRDARNSAALASLGVPDLERRFVTVPAGSVVICNYDIVHRGTRQQPDQPPRYMYKFYFARTHQPQATHTPEQWCSETGGIRTEMQPVLRYCGAWQHGVRPESPAVSEWSLTSKREDERIAAAYQLAATGDQTSLLEGLEHPEEGVRRAAAYGLRASPPDTVEDILPFTQSASASTRRFALFALGNAENAGHPAVVTRLLRAIVEEEDDLARSNAAYALGQVGRGKFADVDGVVDAILDRLEDGVEADNTKVAGLPRSTVRQSLAYALLQIAANHRLEDLSRLLSLTEDRDRYVKGFAEEVQQRQSL